MSSVEIPGEYNWFALMDVRDKARLDRLDKDDEDTLYYDDEFVATSHCGYTKCPECSYKQRFAN